MSRTMAQLATDLTDVIGFEVDEAKAMEWLNARNKAMVVRARAMLKTLTLDPTDGTGTIPFPEEIAEVVRLRVDGGRCDIVPRDTVEDLRDGTAFVTPSGRKVYATEASAAGAITAEVYPTPDAGLTVTVLASVRPADLLPIESPSVPDDFADALVEGAAATGYAYDPEQVSVADRYEARFDARCQEYARWVRRRGRAAGPRQIRVEGFNAG